MTETHRNQIAQLKRKIASQDLLLRQCMKYIQSITPLNQLAHTTITKPPICFGTYPIVSEGNLKTVEMRGEYDCRVIILKNTKTNEFTLDIDALEKMTELQHKDIDTYFLALFCGDVLFRCSATPPKLGLKI